MIMCKRPSLSVLVTVLVMLLVGHPASAKELTEANKKLYVTAMLDALAHFRARSQACGNDPEDAQEIALFLAVKYGFARSEAQRYLALQTSTERDRIPNTCNYSGVQTFRTEFLNSLGDFDYERGLK